MGDTADKTWKRGFVHLTVDAEGLVSLWDEVPRYANGEPVESYVKLDLTDEQIQTIQRTADRKGHTP